MTEAQNKVDAGLAAALEVDKRLVNKLNPKYAAVSARINYWYFSDVLFWYLFQYQAKQQPPPPEDR